MILALTLKKKGAQAPSVIITLNIDIYVIRAEGAYLYDAAKHVLNPVQKGDFRKLIGAETIRPEGVQVSDIY